MTDHCHHKRSLYIKVSNTTSQSFPRLTPKLYDTVVAETNRRSVYHQEKKEVGSRTTMTKLDTY